MLIFIGNARRVFLINQEKHGCLIVCIYGKWTFYSVMCNGPKSGLSHRLYKKGVIFENWPYTLLVNL